LKGATRSGFVWSDCSLRCCLKAGCTVSCPEASRCSCSSWSCLQVRTTFMGSAAGTLGESERSPVSGLGCPSFSHWRARGCCYTLAVAFLPCPLREQRRSLLQPCLSCRVLLQLRLALVTAVALLSSPWPGLPSARAAGQAVSSGWAQRWLAPPALGSGSRASFPRVILLQV